MNGKEQKALPIFMAALGMDSTEEREQYLDDACKDDPELRERVEELLAAQEQTDGYLIPEWMEDEEILEGPGTVIGHYKLLEKIGEGAFGVVFMADQVEPIRRRVALKIVKPGMDSKQVIARFEAERQALALMDHPNIARVIDAGSTDSGRPYFVMELVHGVPITKYCDDNKLTGDERLKLFIPVCDAVQHAHQKGIIHRDLKPSNILVTLYDGKPVPKVIDFGTAKALLQPLTNRTMFTAYGRFIGTPQYMSPEQAEMSGLDVDTRADIYSLGVLLYELMTGTTPFEADRIRNLAFDKMIQMIREENPPKPSTRVSSMGDRVTDIAMHRQVNAHDLLRSLKGDLDWVMMKCLEKDRTRRYATANGLAMDIERYLGNEPVVARPPSAAYRFKKSIKRNKWAYIAAGAIAIALVAGVVSGFGLARRENLLRKSMIHLMEAQDAAYGEKWDEASDLLLKIPDNYSDPSGVHVYLRRIVGVKYALDREWETAAAHLTVLIKLNRNEQDDHREVSVDYMRCMTALIRSDDMAGFESMRKQAVARYGNTQDPTVAERIVRACLLTPPDDGLLEAMSGMGDLLALAHADPFEKPSYMGPNGEVYYWDAWRCLALALLDFRRGAYTNSVAVGKEGLEYSDPNIDNSWGMRNAGVLVTMAMDYHQLGDTHQARSALDQADELIKEAYSHEMAPNFNFSEQLTSRFGRCWFDWEMAAVLFDEARNLIEGTP